MNNRQTSITFPCFTHEQVKEINKRCKLHTVGEEDPSDAAITASKNGDFFHIPCPPLMELLHPWLYECQNINKRIFGYDIYWDFHLEGFNYNVYGLGGEYEWHIDSNKEDLQFDPKLTCLLNLSEEPYEGGEFYMTTSNEKHEFTSGMGLVFNSLIAHEITPVTKGERITLTYWGVGPLWR